MDAIFRMLEHTNDLVLQIDSRGIIQRAGPRPLPAGLFTTRELCGAPWQDVLYPCVVEQLREHLDAPTLHPQHLTLRPHHGTSYEIHIAWDSRDATWLLLGKRSRAPKLATPSTPEGEQERLRQLLDALPHGVIIQGRDLRVTFINATGSEMMGWRHNQSLHRSPYDPDLTTRFIHPNGAELVPDDHPAPRVLREGAAIHNMIVGVFDVPDQQTPRWLEVSATPLRDHEGQIHRIIVTFTDITARKQALEEIRREHRLLREIMAASLAGITVLDARGDIIYANQMAEQILGVSRAELLARRYDSSVWADMVANPANRGHVRRAFEEVARRREPILDLQQVINRADGTQRMLSINAAPVLDERGEVERLVFSFTDITQRAEEEAQRERLEADMAERSRLEGLAVLAGGVAHDFNNLLVGILGAADLLDDDAEAEARADSVELIRQSAEQAAALTRQLLAFSGRAPGDPQRVCLNESVRSSTRLLRALVPQHVVLDLALSEEALLVTLDLTHTRQILANLVLNAVQAIDARPGRITVTSGLVRHAEGDLATLQIRDDGPGMDAATRARIFEPFFTTKAQGHGLGLAAAQGFMRAQGGNIRVESAPGEGTVFTLSWPIVAPADEDTPRLATISEPSTQPPGVGVLLIDDEPLIQRFVSRALSRQGYHVWSAASGEEGLALFQVHRDAICVALVDLTMPGMSGTQALHALRGLAPHLPLVLMSGQLHIDGDTIPPDTQILHKPFTPGLLQETIEALLSKG